MLKSSRTRTELKFPSLLKSGRVPPRGPRWMTVTVTPRSTVSTRYQILLNRFHDRKLRTLVNPSAVVKLDSDRKSSMLHARPVSRLVLICRMLLGLLGVWLL